MLLCDKANNCAVFLVIRKKQEMAERRRDMKMREKLNALKAEEKEKVVKFMQLSLTPVLTQLFCQVKAGKNPFFLKKSAIKDIALEQR